jgi:hypothetical protein
VTRNAPRISPALRNVPLDRARRMLDAASFGWRVRRADGSEPTDSDRVARQTWEPDDDGVIELVVAP